MFNIIPLILILAALVAIIIVVVRKFSVLANLDVDTIQEERESKFKEQIIGNRLKRNFFKYYSRLARLFAPAGRQVVKFFKWMYQKLLEFKESDKDAGSSAVDIKETSEQLLTEAEELVKQGDTEKAEDKYIEIIALDSKSIKTFRNLGRLYYEKKNYGEARQTMEHAAKLLEAELIDAVGREAGTEGVNDSQRDEEYSAHLAAIYYDLVLVEQAMENYKEAIKTANKALKIEPNNPRYLDIKFEISIIDKDKANALDAYDKLKEVNPENQKLPDFKREISEL